MGLGLRLQWFLTNDTHGGLLKFTPPPPLVHTLRLPSENNQPSLSDYNGSRVIHKSLTNNVIIGKPSFKETFVQSSCLFVVRFMSEEF